MIKMPYILENRTKTFSHLRQLYEHTKNDFQTNLRLDNSFPVQKLGRKFF